MRRWNAAGYVGPTCLAVAACQTWFKPGTYIATGDLPPFMAVGLQEEHAWLWNHLATGAGSPSAQIALAPQVWLVRLLDLLGGSDVIAQRLFYSLLFGTVALAGTYFARSFSVSPVAGAASGIVFAFNPFVMTQLPNPLPLLTLTMLGAMGGMIVRAADDKKVSPVAFATLSVGGSYLSINPPLLAITVLWLLLLTLLSSALLGPGGMGRVARFLLRALPWSVLLNSWWLVPLALTLFGSSGSGVNLAAETDVRSWAWTHVRNSLANVFTLNATWAWNQGDYFPYASRLDGSPWRQLRFLLPVIAFAAPFVSRGGVRKRAAVMAFVAIGLIFLSKGLHPPLDELNLWLYDNVPGIWLLREPFAKLAPMLVVIYGLLVAFSLDALFQAVKETDLTVRGGAAAASCTALIGIVAYPSPLWNGEVIPDRENSVISSAHVIVPQAWRDVGRLLNDDKLVRGKALVLPLNDYYQMPTTWGYYGTDYLARLLIRRPVIQLLPGSYFDERPSYVKLVKTIEDLLARDEAGEVPEVLEKLGVSHVILRHDLVARAEGRTFKDAAELAPALRRVQGLRLQRSFGLLDVFKITTSDGQLVRTQAVRRDDRPELTWKRANPSRYSVQVQEARQPFTLILTESYGPGWKLKGLPPDLVAKHVQVDGYANGWRLPPLRNKSLFLEYVPATKARIALRVSQFTALIVMVWVAHRICGGLVRCRGQLLVRKGRDGHHREGKHPQVLSA